MKTKLIKAYHQTAGFLKRFAKGTKNYFKHNALFITFVITTLIEGSLLRFFTVKNFYGNKSGIS